MSEIQDIITNASIKAFNSGLAHGVVQERDRIIELLEVLDIQFMHPEDYTKADYIAGDALDLIELIQKGRK